jgi:DNA uptake protein and related DNA-binding proteins
VRAAARSIAVAFLLFGLCFCVGAQNQDRDTRGIPRTSASAPPPEDRVDINHASLSELLKVPGMTQTWAARIVRYRPYSTKADLLQRGIVPDAVYNRIRDYVIAHREKR